MLALLRWFSGWPLWLLHAVGSLLGWLTYVLSPSYRRRLRANAARAGVTVADRRASIGEAGRLVAELPRLWLRAASEPIADPVQWEGREQLQVLLARGRGLVLLTPHLGSFEVSAQAYAQEFGQQQPMTVLYRPARKRLLRELEETARARAALATAPATLAGVRQLLRALKKGQTVGLLPDQVPPQGMGVWAPFFGQPAYTMTLAARLVQQTGAAVGLLWTERLPHGAGYRVHASELPEPLPAEADDETAARIINRAMEAVILRCPRQYLWGYHRYKSPRRVEGG